MASAFRFNTLLYKCAHAHGCVHPKDKKQNSSIASRQGVNSRHPPLAHAASTKPTKNGHINQWSEVKRAIALTSERAFALTWGFLRAHGNARKPNPSLRLMTCQLNNKSHTGNPNPKPSRSGPGPTHQPGTPPAPNHPLKLQH